jgi:hypothetical protein
MLIAPLNQDATGGSSVSRAICRTSPDFSAIGKLLLFKWIVFSERVFAFAGLINRNNRVFSIANALIVKISALEHRLVSEFLALPLIAEIPVSSMKVSLLCVKANTTEHSYSKECTQVVLPVLSAKLLASLFAPTKVAEIPTNDKAAIGAIISDSIFSISSKAKDILAVPNSECHQVLSPSSTLVTSRIAHFESLCGKIQNGVGAKSCTIALSLPHHVLTR